MEATITIKRLYLWAAGLITLLFIAIFVAVVFIQYKQLVNSKNAIKETLSEANMYQLEAQQFRASAQKYRDSIDSLRQKNDSLAIQILLSKDRIKTIYKNHEKNGKNYFALPPDERLRIFAGFVGE
jgi:hypothetical protein